jgi:hypothetical protein
MPEADGSLGADGGWRPQPPMKVRFHPASAGLLAILLAALVLRIVYWYGLVNVDPYAYADAAASIARGQPVFDPDIVGGLYYTQYLRLSLIVPAAFFYRIFGAGEVQSTLFPIVCSLGSCVVAYFMALKVTRDHVAGLIAAFIVAVFPLMVINSTQFLPDTVMAFFSGATILVFWQGLDARDRSWKYRATTFAAAGALWALAFYGRQTAVGLAIPLAGLVLQRRRIDLAMAGGVAGALAVAGVMSLLLISLGGELFEDIRTVVSEGRGTQPGALTYTDLDLSYAKTFVRDEMFIPLTGLVLFASALIALSWRDATSERRDALSLAIIVAGQFIYFEFLMRLPSLYSWWKEPRYMLSMVVTLAAWVGVGLVRWKRLSGGSPVAVHAYIGVALAFLLGFSVQSIRADHAYWEGHRIDDLARELAEVLAGRSEDIVYVYNDDLARYLSFHVGLDRTSFYERSNGRGYLQNRLDPEGHSRVTAGSLVIISPGQDVWSKATAHFEHWDLVWSNNAGTTVWHVPESPHAVAMQPVNARLGDDLTIARAGISRTLVLPQEHIVLSVMVSNASPGARRAWFGTRCGGRVSFAREVEVASSTTLSLDLPVDSLPSHEETDCEIVAKGAGASVTAIASVRVGALVAWEPEGSYSHDPGLERAKRSGWYRNDQPFFSGGGSVVAIEPWSDLTRAVASLPHGAEVWVDLGAYDYGDGGTNVVEIRLNGVSERLAWGSPGSPGVVHSAVALRDVPPGGELVISLVSQGQAATTIDSVAISTVPPP